MTIPLLIAIGILIFLMLMRPGVTSENLGLYLGSGCLFEIFPTLIWGFVITCVHYGFFALPHVINLAPNDPNFPPFLFGAELFLNGIFSLMAMVTAAFVLGKSAGVGFISSVALGYYTYYLACM